MRARCLLPADSVSWSCQQVTAIDLHVDKNNNVYLTDSHLQGSSEQVKRYYSRKKERQTDRQGSKLAPCTGVVWRIGTKPLTVTGAGLLTFTLKAGLGGQKATGSLLRIQGDQTSSQAPASLSSSSPSMCAVEQRTLNVWRWRLSVEMRSRME